MSKGSPPSSVCFQINQENDDRSELTVTWPCYGDDLSQEDEFGVKLAADPYLVQVGVKLAANPYHYHTLDRSHSFKTENQELLDLKLRIVRQQEKLDLLSSKLSQCEVENKAIKAEKAVLVDELAHAHGATQEQPITRRGWFSKAEDNVGSMQLLIDANSKLMIDNARLQVMVDVQAIETSLKLALSECTSKTSLESSFSDRNQEDLTIGSSQHSIQDIILTNSRHSIPEQELKFGNSGDDWIMEGEDIEANDNDVTSKRSVLERRASRKRAARMNSMLNESILSKENTFTKGAARCKSADLLVEFGGTESRRPRRTDGRLCHSLAEGTAQTKSENLLVDFGETQRARSRTLSILKLN
eukprot:CAMPEP_0201994860 /NCGR_PEP_ID=MMETSP0905-20130828/2553_1 /ASSEMBLY_ACC=CAM_ASM_000554 /TAXON_ID=420261 /ORGANISM="Thalassiosira antarctica, Strain CCMP982" /LENGTH=357 /DNA_ID=CAMNT_0048549905 /DNA_START=46 /DNA_END=1119 /DNA_ORIENTATION=+